MSDPDIDKIIEAMDRRDERDGVDRSTHAEHHRFIEEWIERRKARKRQIERIKATAVGGLIVAILSTVAGWLLWVGTHTLKAFHK